MSAAAPGRDARTQDSAWIVALARAVPALVFGLVVTFSSDHSAAFGLIGFGVFAIVSGAVLIAGAVRRMLPAQARVLFLVQGVVTLLAGIAALVLPSGGTPYLVWVVSVWAILCGALELVNGIRCRTTEPGARDWMLTGAFTLLLAIVVLLVPPGLASTFVGPDSVERVLTAAIVVVGAIGAWAVIVGVQLGIATVSLRADARGAREGAAS